MSTPKEPRAKVGVDDLLIAGGWAVEQLRQYIKDNAAPVKAGIRAELLEITDAEEVPFYVRYGKGGNVSAVDLNPPALAKYHAQQHIELFEPDEKRFYSYHAETGLWMPRSPELVRCDISTDVIELARKLFETDKTIMTMVAVKRSESTLDGIAGLAKGFMERRNAFSRQARHTIHCKNGVLDLDAMIFHGFAPEFYSRNQVPADFNPAAECPKFLEFIHQSLDADDVDLIRRWGGTVILGGNPCQAVMLLTGHGGAGKGTLCEIIEEIIGRANVTELRTEHLGGDSRFETFRYIGKTLLVGKDVPGRFLQEKGAATIKKLVGHDWVTAEGKGIRDSFDIRGEFAVLIASNERLQVRLDGECDVGAWRRRLNIIEYAPRPSHVKPVPDFSRQLVREEGSGILSWLISGAVDVLREIQETGNRLRKTQRQLDRVDALLAESTALEVYLGASVEVGDGDIAVNELTSGFFDFCNAKGWRAGSAREVENRLSDLMLRLFSVARSNSLKRDGKAVRGFRGVVMKSNVEGEA